MLVVNQDKTKHGLTLKTLKGTKERLIHTKLQILHLKLISILQGTITVQNHTKMPKNNFSLNITSRLQEAININTLTKAARGTKILGISGQKMLLRPLMLESRGINKTNNNQGRNFLDLKAHLKVSKNLLKDQAHNLISRKIQTGEGEHLEQLLVLMSFKFLTG